MSTADQAGLVLREAREEAGIGLTSMSQQTCFSRSYLGMIETGKRAATLDIVTAYERVLGPIGDDMWRRRNITHPRTMQLDKSALSLLVQSVEQGEPGSLRNTPTSLAADELLASRVTAQGATHLRAWMREGETSTLRVNALSVLARRSERADSTAVIEVLESDEKVRELSLASSVSRLMQYDWQTCREVARDATRAPDPVLLAKRLAKDVVDTKHAEARWCAAHLLSELAPTLAR